MLDEERETIFQERLLHTIALGNASLVNAWSKSKVEPAQLVAKYRRKKSSSSGADVIDAKPASVTAQKALLADLVAVKQRQYRAEGSSHGFK